MGKNKNRNKNESFLNKLRGRSLKFQDKSVFQRCPRNFQCLEKSAGRYLKVHKLDPQGIKNILAGCETIEHQIIALRESTQLTHEDFEQRSKFTSLFLKCLNKHHGAFYEGILFGSTVNGLGFRDSDVDLRLRRLMQVKDGIYEPVTLNDDMIERILRNIAFQTTKCCPSIGEFVPSTRCPVAKLTFYKCNPHESDVIKNHFQEGLKYDVSLSSSNPLASFNSKFLRFLCLLEPRFHLLASVLRYWSNAHRLIVPGYLSSYALVNMLIFFCQTVEPPLLPTVNQMRDLYFSSKSKKSRNKEFRQRALTQLEWHCIVCLRKECYDPSKNTDPLGILLLKFFEFCLNFPYSTHIMTIRPGEALSHKEFEASTQFHPRFRPTTHLTIQDPFDLKHNLTSGMSGGHFRLFMITVRYSYEKLFNELLNRSSKPSEVNNVSEKKKNAPDPRNWGLNTLFVKLTDQEMKEA